MPDPAATSRFLAGDPIRATAALTVLGFHVALVVALPAVQPGPSGLRDAMVATYGHVGGELAYGLRLGLGLFFVLSGYLLSRPLARAWLRGEPVPDPLAYARNRVLRIVPAFWVVAALTVVAVGPQRVTFVDVATVFTFLQIYHDGPVSYHLGQAWSLGTEVQFYLVLGLLLIVARRTVPRRRGWLAPTCAIGACFAVSAMLRDVAPANGPWTLSLPSMLHAFLPGVALAFVQDAATGALARRPTLARRLPLALLVASAAVAVVHVARSDRFDALESVTSSLVAGALVAAALTREWTAGRSWRVVDNRVLRWLGRRSYGIFLAHWGLALLLAPVVGGVEPAWLRATALVGLVLPATILVAAMSWTVIERPALGLRRPPTPGRSRRPPEAMAAGSPRG